MNIQTKINQRQLRALNKLDPIKAMNERIDAVWNFRATMPGYLGPDDDLIMEDNLKTSRELLKNWRPF